MAQQQNRALVPAWKDGVLVPVDKMEVHLQGLRHRAVSVFVLGPDGILLQQRAAGKYHTPGLWANTCCTHPLWDETPLSCAHRRLSEELGLSGLDLEWRHTAEYRADVGGGMTEHEVVDIFVSRVDGPVGIAPNPDEVQAVRWTAHETLLAEIASQPEQFTPWLRIYMTDHAGTIFGPEPGKIPT